MLLLLLLGHQRAQLGLDVTQACVDHRDLDEVRGVARPRGALAGAQAIDRAATFVNLEFDRRAAATDSTASTIALSPSPDLQVTDIQTPSTANEGDYIDVKWTVTNNGQAKADGAWTDVVYMRKVGQPNDPGIYLGTFTYDAGGLDAGKQKELLVELAVSRPFLTRSAEEFAGFREESLLKLLALLEESGIELAYPTRSIHVPKA